MVTENKRQTNATDGRGPDASALSSAVGQLTLVEHCLCPLDSRRSLTEGFVHETNYSYTELNSKACRRANVRVTCPGGLTADDEFFLWGILTLALSQVSPTADFHVTRHFVLRQLGRIDAATRRGGRQYTQLSDSLERLSQVTYQNDRFYDPVRSEHRRVSFGFLSYSLPIDPDSSRAWRIAWDPIFFELCMAARSMLTFDFDVYRHLDVASRRLFLLLHKLFWRKKRTVQLDVRDLAVHVVGFSSSISSADLMKKLARCAVRLAEVDIVTKPNSGWFVKCGKGSYRIRFGRGKYFARTKRLSLACDIGHLSLYDPLHSIGFTDYEIRGIVSRFPHQLVEQWSDVTLAALERNGKQYFTKNPQAYFLHNVQFAAQGRRTPPDWWLEMQKCENRTESKSGRSRHDQRNRGLQPIGDVARSLVDRVFPERKDS